MTSPSSSNTKRSTPCAAGSCGPQFMVKFLISAMVRRNAAGVCRRVGELRIVAVVVADDLGHQGTRLDGHRLVDDAPLLRVIADLDVAGKRKILEKRMTEEAE